MIDYNTQHPLDYVGEGKAYVHSQAFKAGRPQGAPTSGHLLPSHANQLITVLSNVLNEAPEGWADRIFVTVS